MREALMRAAVAALVLVLGCKAGRDRRPDDDPKVAAVIEASVAIKTGGVGASQPEPATYVLADVENRSATDRLVTLGGELLDAAGARVGRLSADELRVPAGGRRAYALVADAPLPSATRARLVVDSAVAVDYPPPIAVEREEVARGDLTVVAAVVRNTVEREATCVVAAAFHDAGGRLLARPFTVVPLLPSASRPVRFEGPRAAARAEIFVGQVAFH